MFTKKASPAPDPEQKNGPVSSKGSNTANGRAAPEQASPEQAANADAGTADAAPDTEAARLEALINSCREKVCPACTVKAEADDTRLRALAEMENFKKRLQREKDEQMKYAAETVLADLLPVLDNLDLAIQYGGNDAACKGLVTGVEMTRKIFLDILKQHGLTPVGETGEAFSPDLHEAVAEEARGDMEPGRVATLHQRGYRLKDRLLRPAKVSVSRKPDGQDQH